MGPGSDVCVVFVAFRRMSDEDDGGGGGGGGKKKEINSKTALSTLIDHFFK